MLIADRPEHRKVLDLFLEEDSGHSVLCIYGPHCLGKTLLVSSAAESFSQEPADSRVSYVDGRFLLDAERNVDGLFGTATSQLGCVSPIPSDPLAGFQVYCETHCCLVIMDHLECLKEAQRFLLVKRIAEFKFGRSRIIVISHQPLVPPDTTVEILSIGVETGLTDQAAAALIDQIASDHPDSGEQLSLADLTELIELSHRHPWLLQLLTKTRMCQPDAWPKIRAECVNISDDFVFRTLRVTMSQLSPAALRVTRGLLFFSSLQFQLLELVAVVCPEEMRAHLNSLATASDYQQEEDDLRMRPELQVALEGLLELVDLGYLTIDANGSSYSIPSAFRSYIRKHHPLDGENVGEAVAGMLAVHCAYLRSSPVMTSEKVRSCMKNGLAIMEEFWGTRDAHEILTRLTTMLLCQSGAYFEKCGQWQSGVQWLERALEYEEREAGIDQVAQLSCSIGALNLRLRRPAVACEILDHGLSLAREKGMESVELDCLFWLMIGERQLGRFEAASQRASLIVDSLAADSHPKTKSVFMLAQASFELEQGDLNTARKWAVESIGLLGKHDSEYIEHAQSTLVRIDRKIQERHLKRFVSVCEEYKSNGPGSGLTGHQLLAALDRDRDLARSQNDFGAEAASLLELARAREDAELQQQCMIEAQTVIAKFDSELAESLNEAVTDPDWPNHGDEGPKNEELEFEEFRKRLVGLHEEGRHDQMLAECRQALEQTRNWQNEELECEALLFLGGLLSKFGEPREGMNYLLQGRELQQSLRLERLKESFERAILEAEPRIAIANDALRPPTTDEERRMDDALRWALLQDSSDPDVAFRRTQEALEIAERINERKYEVACRLQLARFHNRKEEWRLALTMLDGALVTAISHNGGAGIPEINRQAADATTGRLRSGQTATDHFRLEVSAIIDESIWGWRLLNEAGELLSVFGVVLDRKDRNFAACHRLADYVEIHSQVDDDSSNDDLATRIGSWIGSNIYGHIGGVLKEALSDVTVILSLGREAIDKLWGFPFELAVVNGTLLITEGLSLVHNIGAPTQPLKPAHDTFRFLGIFSQPESSITSSLNLYEERRRLQLICDKLRQDGRNIEFRALQYGVTRGKLAATIGDDAGWDVLHISCHGGLAAQKYYLLLESPEGGAVPVSGDALLEILAPLAGRVRLVFISACHSAATQFDNKNLWPLLGPAPNSDENLEQARNPGESASIHENISPSITRRISEALGCVVIANRFAVDDMFAIVFSEHLYGLLLSQDVCVAEAVRQSLRESRAALAAGAISSVTPMIVGKDAAVMRLHLPQDSLSPGEKDSDEAPWLPDMPEYFVGRVPELALARKVICGVGRSRILVINGMPGIGKSALARVFASTSNIEDEFESTIWCSLDRLATAESQWWRFVESAGGILPELRNEEPSTGRWLERFLMYVTSRPLLIVIDGLEAVLNHESHWADNRWGELAQMLAEENVKSRTVMTTTLRPTDFLNACQISGDADDSFRFKDVAVLTLEELRRDETVNLLQLMPKLSRLNGLWNWIIDLLGGHPEITRLLDRAVVDATDTQNRLEGATEAWLSGTPSLPILLDEIEDAGGLIDRVNTWVAVLLKQLSAESNSLLKLLCSLEPSDRSQAMLKDVFDLVSNHVEELKVADMDGLSDLSRFGCIQRPTGESDLIKGNFPVDCNPNVAITDSVLQWVEKEARKEVAKWMGLCWLRYFEIATGKEQADFTSDSLALRASLSMSIYWLRAGKLASAVRSLGETISRQPSTPSSVGALLPLARVLARAARDTDAELACDSVLAKMEIKSGLEQAPVSRLNTLLVQAEQCNDHRLVSGLRTLLAEEYERCGDFGRARDIVALQSPESTAHQDLQSGPWNNLADRIRQLQLEYENGSVPAEYVLRQARALLAEAEALPEHAEPDETVLPANVIEVCLDLVISASSSLGQWRQAINACRRKTDSLSRRRAPIQDFVRAKCNELTLRLDQGHVKRARELLLECRESLESIDDNELKRAVYTAMARLEAHGVEYPGDLVVRHATTALHYAYLENDAAGCAICHWNLSLYELERSNYSTGCPHRLAAMLVWYQTEHPMFDEQLHIVSANFAAAPPTAVPESIDVLCQKVQTDPQVDLSRLLRVMPQRRASLMRDTFYLVIERIRCGRKLADEDWTRQMKDALKRVRSKIADMIEQGASLHELIEVIDNSLEHMAKINPNLKAEITEALDTIREEVFASFK